MQTSDSMKIRSDATILIDARETKEAWKIDQPSRQKK